MMKIMMLACFLAVAVAVDTVVYRYYSSKDCSGSVSSTNVFNVSQCYQETTYEISSNNTITYCAYTDNTCATKVANNPCTIVKSGECQSNTTNSWSYSNPSSSSTSTTTSSSSFVSVSSFVSFAALVAYLL